MLLNHWSFFWQVSWITVYLIRRIVRIAGSCVFCHTARRYVIIQPLLHQLACIIEECTRFQSSSSVERCRTLEFTWSGRISMNVRTLSVSVWSSLSRPRLKLQGGKSWSGSFYTHISGSSVLLHSLRKEVMKRCGTLESTLSWSHADECQHLACSCVVSFVA